MRYAILAAGLLFASPALADPCEAPLPKRGTTFDGSVRAVLDADSLCVGTSSDPAGWVEVRVADFYGPELNEPGGREAKRTLERLVMGRRLACQAGARSYDRVVAVCRVGSGESVGDLMRGAGVSEGGRGR